MGHRTLITLLAAMILRPGAAPLRAQGAPAGDPLEARLWVGGEDEPVIGRGQRVAIGYRTSRDAFVAVFRIDTDGRVSLLSPADPRDDGLREGGRDQDLVLERAPYWTVSDDPGVGYMFLVASPMPFDFGAFGYSPDFGWDLSAVATTVYEDPYLAMDDFIAAILPDWRQVPYALDFVTYHVDAPRSYPRFLCYDCHTHQSFAEWNPYESMCTSYRIVVWDDPYFYPAFRYAGARVVYPRPIANRPRYEVTPRRSGEGWAPIVRVRAAPPAQVTYKESPTTERARPAVSARGRASVPFARARPAPEPRVRAASSSPGARPPAARTEPRRPPGRVVTPAPAGARSPSDALRPARGVRSPGPSVRPGGRAAEPRATGRTPAEGRSPAARPGRAPSDRSGAATRGSTGRRPVAAPTRRPPPRPAARSRPPAARGAAGRGARPPSRPAAGTGAATRPRSPRRPGGPGPG